jgi:hypothetical protein
MAVETATNIGDLNPLWPTGAEGKSDGDNHLRMFKAAARQSFAGFTGAILVSGVDGGAANAYTLTPATALTAYSAKMIVEFTPTANNTGAATLNISVLGAKALVSVAGAALVADELVAGRYYAAFYDGTQFRLLAVTKKYIDTLAVAGIVPGINDPANAGKALVGGGSFVSLDSRGDPITNKGSTGTTAQVVNYADGDAQTITATGNFALSATGFPAGRFAAVLVRGINLGAFALTTTGITWLKSDNTTTPTFSASGITFPAAGTGFFALFSYGDGIIYGAAR